MDGKFAVEQALLYSLRLSCSVRLQHSTYEQFFPSESGKNGGTLAGHLGLLADVYAQEVVAQAGARGKMCRCWC